MRQIYAWLLDEGLSLRMIAKRLNERGIPSPTGGLWPLSTVSGILKNEVNIGTRYFKRTEAIEPKKRRDTRTYRKRAKTAKRNRPAEDWIAIPVPAIVDQATWDRAQARFKLNSKRARRNTKREYLLRGLVKCGVCGHSYSGAFTKGYRYHRCCNRDETGFGPSEKCKGYVRANAIEEIVWAAVSDALKNPGFIFKEYEKRIAEASTAGSLETEAKRIECDLKRVQLQENRLIDAYREQVIEVDRFKVEMHQLKHRKDGLEKKGQTLERKGTEQVRLENSLEYLETFCSTFNKGLEDLAFEERQQLLRLVVGQIVITGKKVRIDAVINLPEAKSFPSLSSPHPSAPLL